MAPLSHDGCHVTPRPDQALSWVVGSGGLLGQAVTSRLRRDDNGPVLTSRIPWADVSGSRSALQGALVAFLDRANSTATSWRIAWCAGAGVTGTSAQTLRDEVTTFHGFLDVLTTHAGPATGTFFLASSAGGVYAGASSPPFTEAHQPRALAPYGEAKLAAEAAAGRFAQATGNRVIIGRIANLYGPGQNLAKAQGLISHLCRAHITGQPLSVYVSLDTIRDYLYVDDCAGMISDALRLDPTFEGPLTTKILASHQGTTVGALIGECRRVFKRTPRLVLGTSATAKFQVKDLRLRSTVWPELNRRALTTLPAGIAATAASLLRSSQLARC